MNKHLNEAIERVRTLPDDRQREAAEILFDFVDDQNREVYLTPEQIAEIERRLADDEGFLSDEEARAAIDRLTK